MILQDTDPQVKKAIDQELLRQQTGLEMIASENYTSQAVMEAQGSVLTNKYAEGYPRKRYYGGCEFVDVVEELAIDRAKKLFSAEAANVQPHSGSQANMAAYFALMSPGDRLMGMDLSNGGHLTHGSPVNFSGKLFEVSSYGIDPQSHRLDYQRILDQAKKVKPKVIVAGASAYPRIIDFKAFSEIALEIGAELVVDMAHIAGLVAADLHPSPIPYAAYTTTTTHKTLRGPRGGLVLCREEKLKKLNSQIFPGIQGGPLMHVIAAKAVAFSEALSDEFKAYQSQVIKNAKALAATLMESGLELVTEGTDNHLMLVDLTRFETGDVTGKLAEKWLDEAGITVNKNTVPNESRSPFVTSGIRIGTPAITTRGLDESHMKTIGGWILKILRSKGEESIISQTRQDVNTLCDAFPIYPRLHS